MNLVTVRERDNQWLHSMYSITKKTRIGMQFLYVQRKKKEVVWLQVKKIILDDLGPKGCTLKSLVPLEYPGL